MRLEVPVGDARFGKLQPCPNLPDERLAVAGNNGLRWDEERKLDWSDLYDMNNTAGAVKAVREILERGWGWAYLYGDYGQAKSLILKIAAAEALRQGQEARFACMVDVLDDLRATFNDKAGHDLRERVEYWSGVGLLCLDELDKVKETDWVGERIFQILNRRYDAAIFGRRSLTLIASQITPEKLSGALQSRVRDGRFAVIEMRGDDARPGMTVEDRL